MPYNNDREHIPSGNLPDEFDRLLGNLTGLPGVTSTRESTITVTPPLGIGGSRTFIVQTYRQRDEMPVGATAVVPARDTIFLQCIGRDVSFRVALPAEIANAIARQRDALATKSRVKAGKARAARDKAEGKVPGFMRGKRKGKK